MDIKVLLTPEGSVIQTGGTDAVSTTDTKTENFSEVLEQAQTTASSDSLMTYFKKASDTYGVSINLLTAMAQQESNFQADATSSHGAMGIMQLMPDTAKYLGCENPYDPEENIMAGAKYIRELLDRYNGDTSLALAAYNGGYNNVDKYNGIPPMAEVQNYVTKVTGYMESGVTLPDGTAIAGTTNQTVITRDTIQHTSSIRELLDELYAYEEYRGITEMFIKELQEMNLFSDSDTAYGNATSSLSAAANNTLTASNMSVAETADTSLKTMDVTIRNNFS